MAWQSSFFPLRRRDGLIGSALMLATLLLYARTISFGFVSYDDNLYITDNARTQQGLTWENVRWAFTTGALSNWHPLTWLSHMLDVQLYNLRAGGHHLSSVLIHAVNALLLYLVLVRLAGLAWPAAGVAVLWAWHPLRVESVAWVSERKDVLSTFFWLAGMLAYVAFVQRRSAGRYLLVLVLLALGLMAKPMVVTFPFAMLLIDVWPMRRLRAELLFRPSTAVWSAAWPVLREKLPMLGVVIASAVVTYLAQAAGGMVGATETFPLPLRVANAILSYAIYLRMIVAPYGLSFFYPHAGSYPGGAIATWQITLAAAVLLSITVASLLLLRRMPWVAVGWFWYLGTLLPVIGLVQVGTQAHADRYTYLPAIGLSIALVWTVYDLCRQRQRALAGALLAAATLVLLVVTWRQIGFWRDNETLMRRGIAASENNYIAHNNLGSLLHSRGDVDGAIAHYQAALAIRPGFASALMNLGQIYAERGDTQRAIDLLRRALTSDPRHAPSHMSYANLLMDNGQVHQAIEHYRYAIALEPDRPQPRHNLALALASRNEMDEAVAQWRAALRLRPDYADANHALGMAMILRGRTADGIDHLRRALEKEPDRADSLNALAWILATHPNPAFQDGREAVVLARRALEQTNHAIAHDTLAAALARAREFEQAIAAAQVALARAKADGDIALIRQIEQRIQLYQRGEAFVSGRRAQ
jgi:protein O-mannosyl-transferase